MKSELFIHSAFYTILLVFFIISYNTQSNNQIKMDIYIFQTVIIFYLFYLVMVDVFVGIGFTVLTVLSYIVFTHRRRLTHTTNSTIENMTIEINSDLIQNNIQLKTSNALNFAEKQNTTDEDKSTVVVTMDEYFNEKRIPKNIIQVWKTWSSKTPAMFSSNVELLKKKNPSYKYMFFKDEMIDEFFTENYPEYYETYQNLPLNIQKVDFCRYVLLYHYGGFYFDLDIKMLHPLDNSLLTNECVFPVDEIIDPETCKGDVRFNTYCDKIDILLGQYGFGCCKKSPFMKQLIDAIHNNLDNNIKTYKRTKNREYFVYQTTGPDFVTKEYLKYKNKKSIKILTYAKRQHFGKYAIHEYIGTWK